MNCYTKGAKAKKLTEAYQNIGKSVLAYLDASAGCVVHDHFGYKKKRLQDMFDTTQDYLDYMMDVYGKEKDDHRKRAETALKKVADKLLEYADFDFFQTTKEYAVYRDEFFDKWHKEKEVRKHATREKFINDMEPVAQIYHAELLHWFWLHKGFGKWRLETLCKLLRQDYNLMITEYLRCSAAGDDKIQTMLKERQDRLEALGMEFEEV